MDLGVQSAGSAALSDEQRAVLIETAMLIQGLPPAVANGAGTSTSGRGTVP